MIGTGSWVWYMEREGKFEKLRVGGFWGVRWSEVLDLGLRLAA